MMHWTIRAPITSVILALLFAQPTLAADEDPAPGPAADKELIVYLGMDIADGVSVSKALRPVIEDELVKILDMDRYQILPLTGAAALTIDDFTDQLEALADSASEQAPPTWGGELDRIRAAAFVCEAYLTSFDVSLDATRGGQKATVSISAALDLYRLDLSEPGEPRAQHVAQVGKVVPVSQITLLREQGSLDAQLAPMVRRATRQLVGQLTLQLRKLPDFELQAKLLRAEGDQLVLPMGKALGVKLGDAFIVRERGADGQSREVAYTRIREVAPETSRAQIISTSGDWAFSGDEIAVKGERSGFSLSAAAVLEYTGLDLFGNGGPGFYPGFNLTFSSDLSASVDWPEFYLAVDLDYLSVGSATAYQVGLAADVHLGHATIGLHKRWNFGRLALLGGLRAGLAYYIYSESGIVEQGAAGHVGFGGDLVFGTEVFLAPWATLALRFVGRYFSNPIDWVEVPYDEIALRLEGGVRFTF